jgi:hypothetical protein
VTHLTAAELSKTYGLTARHWIRLAARGKVPGAYQPAGEGGKWLFDEDQAAKFRGNSSGALVREIDLLVRKQLGMGPARPKPRMGYVYLLVINDRVKIGFTTEPKKRIAAYSSAHGYVMKFAACQACPKSYERKLHRKFKEHHIRWEWFAVQGKLAELLADPERNLAACFARFKKGLR